MLSRSQFLVAQILVFCLNTSIATLTDRRFFAAYDSIHNKYSKNEIR